MPDIISEFTRIAFREAYVHNSVLSDITKDFGEAGIEQKDLERSVGYGGQRRTLVERYYASVDWASATDIQKVLKAYGTFLQRLYISNKGEFHGLVEILKDDDLNYRNGIIKFQAVNVERPTVGDNITVSTLGNMRRELVRLMDLAEGQSNRVLTPGKRVSDLRIRGILPSHVAFRMSMIINFRNEAEYNQYVLSPHEADVVHTWHKDLLEWAGENGWNSSKFP